MFYCLAESIIDRLAGSNFSPYGNLWFQACCFSFIINTPHKQSSKTPVICLTDELGFILYMNFLVKSCPKMLTNSLYYVILFINHNRGAVAIISTDRDAAVVCVRKGKPPRMCVLPGHSHSGATIISARLSLVECCAIGYSDPWITVFDGAVVFYFSSHFTLKI